MATTFAELFGGVFPTAGQVQTGVVYGPLGNDLTGTFAGGGDATLAKQEEILADLNSVLRVGQLYTHTNNVNGKSASVIITE